MTFLLSFPSHQRPFPFRYFRGDKGKRVFLICKNFFKFFLKFNSFFPVMIPEQNITTLPVITAGSNYPSRSQNIASFQKRLQR